MVIQKARNSILLLQLCFSAKVKKRQSSGEMMSINHGVFAGLCIKTQTQEQAKNFKHSSRKYKLSEDLGDKTKQTN